MDKSKGKQREKRKMNQKNGNKKKKFRSKYSSLPDLREVFQEIRDKKQLAVRCGKMAGCLHRIKYDIGENCILCRGKWYSPTQFEVIGGKRHNKKWKFSIYYMPSNGFQQVQLLELIKSGVLPEFGHLRESFKQVTQTDKGSANSKAVQNMMRRSELMNALKGFPESWKRLFSKTVSIPVCGIEENTLQRETIQPDSSSDESVSVAERVKMKRRESVNSTETVSKKTTEPVGSTSSDRDKLDIQMVCPKVSRDCLEGDITEVEIQEAISCLAADSPACPVDASELGVSPVVEEAVQTTDDPTAAAQLSFSASPAEWQNPVASEETQETRQLQLYEFLTKQFNTINNTLQSIDLSLKKLVEKQSHDTLPQYFSVTPAVIENPQSHSLVKQV